jgi:hypothetical protein
MKIISLSSIVGGEACGVRRCIQKFFHNNDSIETNFFDWLLISFVSINEILENKDNRIENLNFNINGTWLDQNVRLLFDGYNYIESVHDIHVANNLNESMVECKEKYLRRFKRLINSICGNEIIIFIRFGKEGITQENINNFFNILNKINGSNQCYLINLYNFVESSSDITVSNERYYYINFANHVMPALPVKDNDLGGNLNYDWKLVHQLIESIAATQILYYDLLPPNFDSKKYIELNSDLKHLNEDDAIRHYLYNGELEKRIYK